MSMGALLWALGADHSKEIALLIIRTIPISKPKHRTTHLDIGYWTLIIGY